MSDDLQNPAEETPQEPETKGTPTPAPEPENVVSHKVYAGLQTRYNKLNEQYKEISDSYGTAQATIEQLTEQLDKARRGMSEREQAQQTLAQQLSELQRKDVRYQAFRTLLTREDGGLDLPPDASLHLFNLLDQIPAGEDVDTTAENILKFAEFGRKVAEGTKSTVGETPGVGTGSSAPEHRSLDEWKKMAEDPANWTDEFWKGYYKAVTESLE